MPELPEVEAARAAIADNCVGKKIVRAIIAADDKVIDGVSPSHFESSLLNKTIVAAYRKGKNLWVQLDSPPFPSFQFGMTGAVYIKGVAVTKYKRSAVNDADEWPSKFSKFFIELNDGLEMSFTDKRRFAKVRLLVDPASVPPISELGPDAFMEPMTEGEFFNSLNRKKIAIKTLLLDQSFISGIGNWITDEVLYQARIHPSQTASSLSREDSARLLKCIKEVLEKAVEVGADSDQYPSSWIFHSREKKPGKAFVDGKKIDFITVGGRMNETSPNNEDLIEELEDQDNDEDMFVIDGNGEESESDHQEFGIEDDDHDHDNGSEQFFGIDVDPNIHGDNEQELELEGEDLGFGSDRLLEVKGHDTKNTMGMENGGGLSQEKYYPPPVEGVEFESYDDAYNYYNSYAKELGFAIRVKSSWTKRNSKEKRGAVLCCNCEGFKTFKEVTSRRKETRTGCLAMIRLRLVESNRWRVDEVKLEHNHLFDPERAQNSKSHKKSEVGAKRPLNPILDVEVRTIKLYRTPTIDVARSRSLTSRETENGHEVHSRHLKLLKAGNSQVIQNYFCQKQLRSPNFFYITDLSDEGQVRNIFWIDSRARASYGYFGDVVAIDTTCLSNKYEIPLVAFIGVNHHGRSIILGCALIAEETVETYVWLFRAWLTCLSGRPPQTIVTDQCKAMEKAIMEVFPRAHHRYWLPLVMQSIFLNSGPLLQSGAFQSILHMTVYGSLKTEEFETSWDNMIQQFGIRDHELFHIWYEDREKWAPVYQKETFLAGLFFVQASDSVPFLPFFAGHVHEQTSMKEFLNLYDNILEKIRQQEALDDLESSGSNLLLRTRCYYELQLSKFYTKEMFEKFQVEVEMMPCCVSIDPVSTTGHVITYVVKERDNGGIKDFRSFEVMYNKEALEVRCICGGFYFNGYLCRHALSVLNHNGVEEIPVSYILPRWTKDCKRLYVPEFGSDVVDISNPCQWYEHLHRRAIKIIEAGIVTQDHFMVAWQAFLESLNKVRFTED